jgi:hypothetical protein
MVLPFPYFVARALTRCSIQSNGVQQDLPGGSLFQVGKSRIKIPDNSDDRLDIRFNNSHTGIQSVSNPVTRFSRVVKRALIWLTAWLS